MPNSELKVGVALGGGGVRGLAHIQALQVIDACGIKPVAIAGTSMGAIIGALYASGMSGQLMRDMLAEHIIQKNDQFSDIYRKKDALVKWMKIFKPTTAKSGMMQADGFMRYLLDDFKTESFEELQIPFQAVATDFYRCKPYIFNSGSLRTAIHASMSIPGVFVPVEHDGCILVDGGLTNQVPYDILPDDCDITIAVDVGPDWSSDKMEPPNAIEAVLGMFDLVIDRTTESKLKAHPPTIYLRPQLKGVQVDIQWLR